MNYRVCENGIYRDMTAEEIAEMQESAKAEGMKVPSAEERLAAVESAILNILGAM